MDLFSIQCTTCGARLKVRSTSAIGQIVSCPKCQSMVQVVAPPGWQPPIASPPSKVDSVVMKKSAKPGLAAAKSADSVPAATLTADSDFGVGHTLTGDSLPPDRAALAAPPFSSPLERVWRRWTLAATSLAAVLFLAIYSWSMFSSPETSPDDVAPGVAAANTEPHPTDETGEPAPAATPTTPDNEAAPAVPAPTAPPEAAAPPTAPVEPKPLASQPAEAKPADAQPAEPTTEAATSTSPPSIGVPATTAKPPAAPAQPARSDSESGQSLSVADRQTLTRLAEPIVAIRFEDAKLADLVQFVSRMTAVTIEFDDQALIDAGIDDSLLVSVRLSSTSAAKVLDAALAPSGLRYTIEAGRVRITVAEKPMAQP